MISLSFQIESLHTPARQSINYHSLLDSRRCTDSDPSQSQSASLHSTQLPIDFVFLFYLAHHSLAHLQSQSRRPSIGRLTSAGQQPAAARVARCRSRRTSRRSARQQRATSPAVHQRECIPKSGHPAATAAAATATAAAGATAGGPRLSAHPTVSTAAAGGAACAVAQHWRANACRGRRSAVARPAAASASGRTTTATATAGLSAQRAATAGLSHFHCPLGPRCCD